MNLNELTVSQLSEKLQTKEISAKELVEDYVNNIKVQEDKIGAYLTLTCENALQSADEIDNKRVKGDALNPLAGVPCAIKDNISTKGVKTTCASKMLQNYVPPFNAFVMDKLESCDAIMLGKLNMDEFAMGSTTENSYFKTTRNPRNTAYAPGGSSGGSAAAVAANEAAFTLGSDTGGSVRQPAVFCGVVGMKPTYGTVSRNGITAFASSLDQIGPITKDVKDNALILNAIVGHDEKDSTSINKKYDDFSKDISGGVKGMKIALPKDYFYEGLSGEVGSAILKAAKVYEKLGATIEQISMPTLKFGLPVYYIISNAEASSNLARFDGVRYGYRANDYANLEEMYKKTRSEGFGQEVKKRIMFGSLALSEDYYETYFKKALKVRTLIIREFASVYEKYDCILAPVSPTNAYKIGEKSEIITEKYMSNVFTVPANIAGVPALALPCGEDEKGLPIGMQLMGRAFSESKLYRTAYAYEQETGAYHLKKN